MLENPGAKGHIDRSAEVAESFDPRLSTTWCRSIIADHKGRRGGSPAPPATMVAMQPAVSDATSRAAVWDLAARSQPAGRISGACGRQDGSYGT